MPRQRGIFLKGRTMTTDRDKSDLIDRYTPIIAENSKASISASRAMIQFIISSYLHNCEFSDDQGTVRPNLTFFHIDRSGSNKTPLIKVFEDGIYPQGLAEEMRMHSDFSSAGFRKSIIKYKHRNGISEFDTYKGVIIRDEATTLAKDSSSNGLSDVFEFLSQIHDGKIKPKETTQRGREEGSRIYSPIWIAGILQFLRYIPDMFWEQGLAFRSCFVKRERTEYKPVKMASETQYTELLTDLEGLRIIREAVADDEFLDLYNEYCAKIHDIVISSDSVESQSYAKFPELILKFAMIFSASRDPNQDVLRLTREEFERARNEAEQYRENLIEFYTEWMKMKTVDVQRESIRKQIFTLKGVIEKLLSKGDTYRIDMKVEPREYQGVKLPPKVSYEAVRDPKGNIISRTSLTKAQALRPRQLNETLKWYEDAEYVEDTVLEGYNNRKVHYYIVNSLPKPEDLENR